MRHNAHYTLNFELNQLDFQSPCSLLHGLYCMVIENLIGLVQGLVWRIGRRSRRWRGRMRRGGGAFQFGFRVQG